MRCGAVRDATSQASSWDSFQKATTKLEKRQFLYCFSHLTHHLSRSLVMLPPEAEVARRSALPGYEISCLLS